VPPARLCMKRVHFALHAWQMRSLSIVVRRARKEVDPDVRDVTVLVLPRPSAAPPSILLAVSLSFV